jgi:hypothetical protein
MSERFGPAEPPQQLDRRLLDRRGPGRLPERQVRVCEVCQRQRGVRLVLDLQGVGEADHRMEGSAGDAGHQRRQVRREQLLLAQPTSALAPRVAIVDHREPPLREPPSRGATRPDTQAT